MKSTSTVTDSFWSIEDARNVYNIEHWSAGYFDINLHGELVAKPTGEKMQEGIPFPALVSAIKKEGLTLPVLVRFSDILHDRVHKLCHAFAKAKTVFDYSGAFTAVYPIKVNQQRRVVEQILRTKENVGLEAGSKPELMAVMALSTRPQSVIICNGYKDREYIRLALIGRILGHRVYLIIEKLSELELILEESQRMNVEPLLGVRIRLSSIGKGKWQNTGGEKSKFGLTSSQLLTLLDRLEAAQKKESLQLIHFHLGSQIANLHDIKKGLAECARYYEQLYRLGVHLRVVDVGGGLGVDYEGTQSRSDCSINYSMEEYAQAVIGALAQVCQANGISACPEVMTESGRALTAHHAVLITQVIDKENLFQAKSLSAPPADAVHSIHLLWDLYQKMDYMPLLESYYDSAALLTDVHQSFSQGTIGIDQKALAEDIFYTICHQVRAGLSPQNRSHRELLDELNEKLADKLFCNFSLFQSIPDAWAIGQIFPIMPLQGLLERPTQRAVLQDLTCDSDGRIHSYVDGQGIESSLPLPPTYSGKNYCLGLFLVGAYQEILGDMHNLFGDTDSVHVEMDEEGQFHLVESLLGDRVENVLRTVHFEPQKLMHSYKQQLENVDLLPKQRRAYLDMLASGLTGYTYLEEEH